MTRKRKLHQLRAAFMKEINKMREGNPVTTTSSTNTAGPVSYITTTSTDAGATTTVTTVTTITTITPATNTYVATAAIGITAEEDATDNVVALSSPAVRRSPVFHSTPCRRKVPKKISKRSIEKHVFRDSESSDEDSRPLPSSVVSPMLPAVSFPSTSGIQQTRRKKAIRALNYEEIAQAALSTSLDASLLADSDYSDSEKENEADLILDHRSSLDESFVSEVGEVGPNAGDMIGIKYRDLVQQALLQGSDDEDDTFPMEDDLGEDAPILSEAAKRVSLMTNFDANYFPNVKGSENILAEMGQLNNLVRNSFLCNNCESKNIGIKVVQTKINMFTKNLEAYCNYCNSSLSTAHTSVNHKLPEVCKRKVTRRNNVRFTLGAMSAGIGYEKALKLFSYLDVSAFSHTGYHELQKDAAALIKVKFEDMKNHAANVVRNFYITNLQKEDVEDAMNITVSFDGTWMTRGHTSNIGVTFIIDAESGIVLDAHIASKYCHKCSAYKHKLPAEDFRIWEMNHKNFGECSITFDTNKSSGAMEAEGAKIMFKRSMEKRLTIFTILNEMTEDKVLDMVSGKTQNANESIHSRLWNIVPKSKFCGYNTLLYAVCQTVLEHNCGVGASEILGSFRIARGDRLQSRAIVLEKKRLKVRKKKESRALKKKRKQRERADAQYRPGGFE